MNLAPALRLDSLLQALKPLWHAAPRHAWGSKRRRIAGSRVAQQLSSRQLQSAAHRSSAQNQARGLPPPDATLRASLDGAPAPPAATAATSHAVRQSYGGVGRRVATLPTSARIQQLLPLRPAWHTRHRCGMQASLCACIASKQARAHA